MTICKKKNSNPSIYIENFEKFKSKQLKDKEYYSFLMHKTPYAFSKVREVKPVFLGWEWEVNNNERPFSFIQDTKLLDFVNFKSGGNPLEMASIPATLQFHKKYMEDLFFKQEIEKLFFEDESLPEVGIHVHIDKDSFTKESLKHFIEFVVLESNRKFMEKIAGRSINKDVNWREPNPCNFTTKDSKIIGSDIVINDSLIQIQNSCSVYGKDWAVNTNANSTTVEFRIFASVLTKEDFYKNLEFTEALVLYSRHISRLKNPYSKIGYSNFKTFVNNRRVKYPNLVNFIKDFN